MIADWFPALVKPEHGSPLFRADALSVDGAAGGGRALPTLGFSFRIQKLDPEKTKITYKSIY
ncbi:MAG: hypothetical protein WA975_09620 [Mesorhizobium sp.]